MRNDHYDIFINYRREPGRDFARTLQQAFKSRGYSVFFDYDSLQDGKFNEEIFSAIENCAVFVVSYSQGSLDRCKNDNDWVRIEIEHALKHGKKIVPIAPSEVFANLTFPEDLPSSLSALRNIETTEIHTGKYFDDSIERCIRERFQKHPGLKKIARLVVIVTLGLAVLATMLWLTRNSSRNSSTSNPDELDFLREGIRSGQIHVMTKEEAHGIISGINKDIRNVGKDLQQATKDIKGSGKEGE